MRKGDEEGTEQDARSPRGRRMDDLSEVVDQLVAVEKEFAIVASRRASLVETARRLSVADAAANRIEADAAGRSSRHTSGWSVEVVAWRELVSEISCALRIPERTAETLVAHSRALVNELPATFAALSHGEVSYRHVEKLIDHVQSLPTDAYAAFEQAVLPHARELTVAGFDKKARLVRERTHPESIAIRSKSARQLRDVFWDPARDGMAYLTAYVTADVAAAGFARLDDMAASLKSPGENRTQAQLRADVFGDLIIDGITTPEAITCSTIPDEEIAAVFAMELAELNATGIEQAFTSGARDQESTSGARSSNGITDLGPSITAASHSEADSDSAKTESGCRGAVEPRRTIGSLNGIGRGITARVVITVPVLALLGQDTDEPATLEGYGPIDPDIAKQLAAAALSFTRILTHPETGTILSVGRHSHPVPADLTRWLQLRDETCRKPGCARPVRRCDIDHTCDWACGGDTCHDNLAHLCKMHHNEKHHTSWRYRHTDDAGTLEWTSPAGRAYLTRPARDMRPPPVSAGPPVPSRLGGTAPPRFA